MPLLLVRHASAGDSSRWEGDDAVRPLDERGRKQAAELVGELEGYPITRIISSPYVRCLQTVEPLAWARGLEVETRDELTPDRQDTQGAELVRALDGSDVVVCGHGGLEEAVPGAPKWRKGQTLVLGPGLDQL